MANIYKYSVQMYIRSERNFPDLLCILVHYSTHVLSQSYVQKYIRLSQSYVQKYISGCADYGLLRAFLFMAGVLSFAGISKNGSPNQRHLSE